MAGARKAEASTGESGGGGQEVMKNHRGSVPIESHVFTESSIITADSVMNQPIPADRAVPTDGQPSYHCPAA